MSDARVDPIPTLVGFGRVLRAAGLDAGPDRLLAFERALERLDVTSRTHVYWAGRVTLCRTPEDLPRYDLAFDAWFGGAVPLPPERERVAKVARDVSAAGDPAPGREGTAQAETVEAEASRLELLRHRDVTTLTPSERRELQRLLEAFWLPGEQRRSRRWGSPRQRRRLDPHETVRELLRHGGEPTRLRYRSRRQRPRPVVLLIDVSGSMGAYADALLRFAHAARRRGPVSTEVFTLGTRLTRVTRQMAYHDPDLALAAVAHAVPDWEGGTRLGVMLKSFLDRWGQQGAARGAVVVVLSDGLERGDVAPLAAQMARLSRLAHRVIWSNPRKGHPGYEPQARGMVAALPHVDAFLEGHSLAALQRLAAAVLGAAGDDVREWPAVR
ncbi:VWA domain-containing protein [Egibacter rhizosphaerae]|uniref:VWA domain-containing protein n=1 Tax=Egibacter rhizosphaerae TaxID=1670831 RepID=A0A411YJR7_9ACTN|nr:VWA domain-containing protein [Egibacter rhizosphaerae]QBI21440.1 VWA domain-containing protein [Egibacter rhizosphaerae]